MTSKAGPSCYSGDNSWERSYKHVRDNHKIHLEYTNREFETCLQHIEEVLDANEGLAEYPLYVKALIRRRQGKIQESLQLFQKATALNPSNVLNLKQVGRSLMLLGKYRSSMEVLTEAKRMNPDDWEVWHDEGICNAKARNYEKAVECFKKANAIHPHDTTYLALGGVFSAMNKHKKAVKVYLDGLKASPGNPELLMSCGLAYLRSDENYKAFEMLLKALSIDPKNPSTILATCSMIQEHADLDTALLKYRVAAVVNPSSSQLWNNVGMCFYGKQKYIASIACLKRALAIDPFDWIVNYNLGLVHLSTGQHASAFHFMSSSINLKPEYPSSYMYLAVILSKLEDIENAKAAYNKALSLKSNYLFELNYAITLYSFDMLEESLAHFRRFEELFRDQSRDAGADPDILEQRRVLANAHGIDLD
ncbi:hypothetical protein HOP50_20g85060 [Chloropicon primus]|uniref:Uncharacterized protein n=2 Tax=Chloropicon primus TaxID=1764295 RepID=A0A5B8MZ85_9CHLO|nr:hypothetical protein A3770_20p84750 [Chloropicon primus]UPR05158.1 hypothetical protein HOP50_20g85060 [Chloropicon primus]|eukprot:QDZ25957.1 hypothetical protein A3770_20p84750 [Chloropicon primus]